MRNQDYTILELGRQNILSFRNYLPQEKLELIRGDDVNAFGLLTEDNEACGALMYTVYPNENVAYLDSICVDESLRDQGLGTMLFEAFEKRCELMGIRELDADVVIPVEEEAMCFFMARGFDDPVPGDRIYEFTGEDILTWLKDPRTESIRKKFLKDDKMAALSLAEVSADIRKKLPQLSYNPKLSYVVEGKESKNYCLADRDDDGNVMILDIRLDTQNSPAYFLFLRGVMANYANIIKKDGKLYIKATTDRRVDMIESLSFLGEFIYYTTLRLTKKLEDPIPESFAVPYGAFLIPRINGVSKMLSDFGEGYEHTVAYDSEGVGIHILRGRDKPDVYLQYELEDTENAGDYTLSLITGFYKPSLTASDFERISEWKEESDMCSFSEDEEHIFARAVILESEGLVNPDFLKTVLDGFMAEIDNMCGIHRLAMAE